MNDQFVDTPKIEEIKQEINVPSPLNEYLKWSSFDGKLPYVWSSRRPPNSCAWTCVWVCGVAGVNVIVKPSDWWPNGTPPEYLAAEIKDLKAMTTIWRTIHDGEVIMLDRYDPNDPESLAQTPLVEDALRRLRNRYPEYHSREHPPVQVFARRVRFGW